MQVLAFKFHFLSSTFSCVCVCVGVWRLQSPKTEGAMEEDVGLVLTVSSQPVSCFSISVITVFVCLLSQDKAKHYAISAKLDKPFIFEGTESFVVQ